MTPNRRAILYLLSACFISVNSLIAQQEIDDNVLDFYRQFGFYTDPGEYAYLYDGLPESLEELCDLIKQQFVHPADLRYFPNVFPEERQYEDPKFPSVQDLLEGLLELDPRGLTPSRKPEDRLVVTCRYHAIFLASILKTRDVPVRVRYGFAPYLAPGTGYHICHAICEVWNADEERWMLVDPDRKMVDFPRDQFELAGDIWLQLQEGEIEPQKYGVADMWGEHRILVTLLQDLAAILKQEPLYWEYPPIAADEDMDLSLIDAEKVKVTNEAALLLRNPDEHFSDLKSLYEEHAFLQYESVAYSVVEDCLTR